MAICNSCGAEILWVVTENGRRAPLSVESKQKRFVLDSRPDHDGEALIRDTYLSHFADCPHADQHRKSQ